MGTYHVLGETSQKIADILGHSLVPELLPDSSAIGVCTPYDRGDFSLTIHLYDLRENGDLRSSTMIDQGQRGQKYPSAVLDLYYMITAFSVSDLKFRSEEEQKLLGKVMQTFWDAPTWEAGGLGNETTQSPLQIQFLNLDLDEKMKIWSDHSKPYRPSLFYRVSPVEVESTRTRTISRVKEFKVTTQRKEEIS